MSLSSLPRAPRLPLADEGLNSRSSVEVHAFADDDPFQTQIDALVAGQPKCTFEEALQTYQLTWAIREAGERERLEEAQQ